MVKFSRVRSKDCGEEDPKDMIYIQIRCTERMLTDFEQYA